MVSQAPILFSHSKNVCNIESIWLDPAYREGRRGIRFVKGLVDAIKALGTSHKIRIFSNDDYDKDASGRSRVARAFEAVGFRQTGTMLDMDL